MSQPDKELQCKKCGFKCGFDAAAVPVGLSYDQTEWRKACVHAGATGPSNCPEMLDIVRAAFVRRAANGKVGH